MSHWLAGILRGSGVLGTHMRSELRVALLLDIWRQGMPADMFALSYLIVRAVRLGLQSRLARFGA